MRALKLIVAQQSVTSEVKLKVAVPPGSRFRGYEDVLVQDLQISVAVTRYRRERWETAAGERIVAPLPPCGFRFDPAHHSEEFPPGIPI